MQKDETASIATLAFNIDKPFDKIVILANKDAELWQRYEQYLKKNLAKQGRPFADIRVNRVVIKSPIDYLSIAKVTEQWISNLSDKSESLAINLTSGTPAMTTLSVLIGKGKSNTYFLQSTPTGKIINVDIPVDFGKQYIMSAAKNLANVSVNVPKPNTSFSELTANSFVMKTVVEKANKLAASEVPALILGETGTGKELMAHAIHKGSLRSDKPIKTVNCGALAESIVESTLFGHKKGAFTGASSDHKGLFEQADGGTLFLDEVGELSLNVQVKLLRALQQGEITRLGDTETTYVDVRIIAATHRDLRQLIEEGKFREDLFYRLAVGVIEMPALRERVEDIPEIVEQLNDQINRAGAKHPEYVSKKLSENAIKFISRQSWHGNIRELWSTLNRAFLWSSSQNITEEDITNALICRQNQSDIKPINLSYNDQVDVNQLIEKFKKEYVLAALKASGYQKKKATKMLGLKDHQTLSNWMKTLEIEIPT